MCENSIKGGKKLAFVVIFVCALMLISNYDFYCSIHRSLPAISYAVLPTTSHCRSSPPSCTIRTPTSTSPQLLQLPPQHRDQQLLVQLVPTAAETQRKSYCPVTDLKVTAAKSK